MEKKLEKGKQYDTDNLVLVGWTEGDGSGALGYDCWTYFDGGVYLGPDEHGIEPLFADLADEPDAWRWAQQCGYDGTYDDWRAMPSSERVQWEQAAKGLNN